MNADLSIIVMTGVISVADIAAAPISPDNFLRIELFQRCWLLAELCSMGNSGCMGFLVIMSESKIFDDNSLTYSFFFLQISSPQPGFRYSFGPMRVSDNCR